MDKSEEKTWKLDSQSEEDKLMKSVLENDKNEIDDGQVITDSINQGMGSFTPDVMFDKMVQNYKQAEQIYGESMVRALSGYDPSYVEKNIVIPEFRREVEKRIKEKFDDLRRKGLVDREGNILEKGYELSSLVMYAQELDNLKTSGFLGERPNKKDSIYGERNNIKNYKSEDRFKDIDIKKSVKTAIRRGHSELTKDDLKVFTRQNKASTEIVYAIDASGSMKGDKIGMSKKAGIALAFKAIEKKDKVGVVVFGKEVKEKIYPTKDFMSILRSLAKVKASSETDLALTIGESVEMFSPGDMTKHLMLITDAMPTVGLDPEKEVLGEVAKAKAAGITVSIAGINLDGVGEKLARKISDVGEGKFYLIKDLKNMDKIILEDYYNVY
ncbi:hypothetical protein C0585_04860 [Candidatus Woesearchaeota archaeon]|nr:MAG: hypothetical protein C0585_04860 [Candidatus Woesearchaeota archaeon]